MPTDRKKLQQEMLGYLDKLQYLALARAEKRLVSAEENIPTSELIKMTKEMKDLQLAIRWTRRLEKVILENPSKLLPPGARGFSLLAKVKEMSSNAKKEQDKARDGRNSGNRNARGSIFIPLPVDSPGINTGEAQSKSG